MGSGRGRRGGHGRRSRRRRRGAMGSASPLSLVGSGLLLGSGASPSLRCSWAGPDPYRPSGSGPADASRGTRPAARPDVPVPRPLRAPPLGPRDRPRPRRGLSPARVPLAAVAVGAWPPGGLAVHRAGAPGAVLDDRLAATPRHRGRREAAGRPGDGRRGGEPYRGEGVAYMTAVPPRPRRYGHPAGRSGRRTPRDVPAMRLPLPRPRGAR